MYTDITDATSLANIIEDYANERAVLVCLAEHSDIEILHLIRELNSKSIHFAGAIFPKVIYESKAYDSGAVINFFDNLIDDGIFLIKNIDSKDFEIPHKELNEGLDYCLMTFVDGLTPNISYYLSELYRSFGNKTFYLGGGAGNLSLKQEPCVFNKEGIFKNAAVSMILNKKVRVGVKHGWEKIAGPVIATKTSQNVINNINWQNAFEIYKKAIEENSEEVIEPQNFFDTAKSFPFGILKEGSEYVVRDPISINDKGGLVCVGEVPENTMLDILKGDKKALINAAKAAANLSMCNVIEPKQVFVFDCISRVLFLEDDFEKELSEVVQILKSPDRDIEITGALTLGEISSYDNGYLEFYNKSIVIGLFE